MQEKLAYERTCFRGKSGNKAPRAQTESIKSSLSGCRHLWCIKVRDARHPSRLLAGISSLEDILYIVCFRVIEVQGGLGITRGDKEDNEILEAAAKWLGDPNLVGHKDKDKVTDADRPAIASTHAVSAELVAWLLQI